MAQVTNVGEGQFKQGSELVTPEAFHIARLHRLNAHPEYDSEQWQREYSESMKWLLDFWQKQNEKEQAVCTTH